MNTLCVTATKFKGFTLAELLVALGVLGIIATFSIPKILTSSTNAKYNAMAKETASTISQAYQQYKSENNVSGSFNPIQLLPYLNTVKADTTSSWQDSEFDSPTTFSCSETWATCRQLHNGGLLTMYNNNTFGTTDPRNFVFIEFDPDGSGPAFDVTFKLYVSGRVFTEGDMSLGGVTYDNGAPADADAVCVLCNPSWWKNWK